MIPRQYESIGDALNLINSEASLVRCLCLSKLGRTEKGD